MIYGSEPWQVCVEFSDAFSMEDMVQRCRGFIIHLWAEGQRCEDFCKARPRVRYSISLPADICIYIRETLHVDSFVYIYPCPTDRPKDVDEVVRLVREKVAFMSSVR